MLCRALSQAKHDVCDLAFPLAHGQSSGSLQICTRAAAMPSLRPDALWVGAVLRLRKRREHFRSAGFRPAAPRFFTSAIHEFAERPSRGERVVEYFRNRRKRFSRHGRSHAQRTAERGCVQPVKPVQRFCRHKYGGGFQCRSERHHRQFHRDHCGLERLSLAFGLACVNRELLCRRVATPHKFCAHRFGSHIGRSSGRAASSASCLRSRA